MSICICHQVDSGQCPRGKRKYPLCAICRQEVLPEHPTDYIRFYVVHSDCYEKNIKPADAQESKSPRPCSGQDEKPRRVSGGATIPASGGGDFGISISDSEAYKDMQKRTTEQIRKCMEAKR